MKLPKNLVVVCNLDVVKKKNLYQVHALPEYRFLFAAYERELISDRPENADFIVYPRTLIARIGFVFRLLMRHRAEIHHLELYTGNGAFFAIEFLIARLLRIDVVVAERGALLRYQVTSASRRAAFRYVYRFAQQVWLRELWMLKASEGLVRRQTFFCFNAVELPRVQASDTSATRDIDFLWVNSFKPWRNATWLCHALRDQRLACAKVEMVGLLANTSGDVLKQQQLVAQTCGESIRLHAFGDPEPYFKRAKYFVLPANIVFLNFALLEAMARGVVPLVSDVEGAREIVEDGVEGIVFSHTPQGLKEAMLKAQAIDAKEWQSMSLRAQMKVERDFSTGAWAAKMRSLYARVGT